MWANCGAVFSSLSDLVGHVNLQHLRIPPAPQPSTLMDPSFGIDSLSCQWGDCTAYPSPSSIPGSSTGNLHDSATCILATHLLNDHLGIHNHEPFSGNVPVTAQTQAPAFPDPVESLASPPASLNSASHSPSPSPHECSGTHICHWKSCSESFSSCDELTAHITAVHIGSGKPHYDCFWEGCTRHGENGFTSKQKISRHLQSHTGHRPFQCTVCKQNFSEAATLQQHMRRHTQEKPYVCDFPGCGKAFAITGALTIHKRTHNGHKPFKCTYCERAFAESSNLSKHLRTHTGARPYTCTADGCGKAFARPDQLARHMSVHRKKGGGPKV
ncbi:hypothetical protein SERLA73DRAFT_184700 [Serpula lacrymans var. lacrymans S7.3]|uniref:C2H2-type domain-containing protein n=2 Tax=Serpula lacrymans var. lacrymans TaxID=341189 RepID=F8Q4Y1_SERL3|nr:uncharacterized protein SERLADRAFT_472621 [Serpula lacrymans var. lacrymans S7.9]EGN96608.1 hypothetical protein SERLA73DRAFT_184700 [Serpula lacrymans var. lacrymans S7.3]EGO22177.1 hypothetical protein SERLADRAFT_472621 [Serpula lacrymans var. lacrymans S7.9]